MYDDRQRYGEGWKQLQSVAHVVARERPPLRNENWDTAIGDRQRVKSCGDNQEKQAPRRVRRGRRGGIAPRKANQGGCYDAGNRDENPCPLQQFVIGEIVFGGF